MVQDLQANDPARRPWFFKRYPQQLPRMSLPRDLPATTAPAIAVLAGAADLPRTELDLPQLSRLLHLSAGVVRTMEQPYGTHLFRAAGSAGGRVVVHDVEGLAPGVYRWPDLSAPARAGALRDELHRACLDQALARDAAFVVIAAADMDGFDDRDYREAQLAAGLAEGRLHLAAYALGASASGMTFIDSEVPSLLGEPLNALLFTCVGVPQYASAAGGPPGAPTPVRLMTSR